MSNFINIPIGEIGTTITGKTPSSSCPEDFGKEYMFITPSDNFDDKTIYLTNRYLSSEGLIKLKNKKLPPKSVLVSCIGSAMGKVTMNNSTSITNQQINSIIVNSKYDADYIYYILKNNYKLLRNASSGSTALPMLNKTDFDKLIISIEKDKFLQQKIAKFLSDLDAKIELNNKINAELEALAKTLYDYWFVQFDFPDANGKPYKTSDGKMVWNEELKREIPEGWENGLVSDLFELNPTLSLKKNSISSYIDMNALPTDGFMTKAVQEKEFNGGVKFQNGDVAIARITPCLENGKTGLITLLKENEIGFGSTEFIVIRGKDMPLSCFGAFLSRSELFRKYSIANMLGTSGRKRVEASKIGMFPIALPNKVILKRFEKIVSLQFKQATINIKENQQLASLRDWLLPMLMNGQVRVGDVEEELGMVAESGAKYEIQNSVK